MKRLRKFTRLVLGDFMCDVVLPSGVGVVITGVALYVLSIIGHAGHWLGMFNERVEPAFPIYLIVGILICGLATTIGVFIAGFIRLIFWLRRKWHEAAKP